MCRSLLTFQADVGDDECGLDESAARDGEGDLSADGTMRDRRRSVAPAISPVEGDRPRRGRRPRRPARVHVHPADNELRLRPRRAVEARSEESVDDDLVAVELVRLVGDMSRLAENARRDPPVSSVRAAAADTREGRRARKGEHRLARDGRPGALHQLGATPGTGVPLLGRTHLGGAVERLERPAQPPARAHDGDRGRDLARVRHREVDRPACDTLRKGRFAPTAAHPASAARRSRSPSR